MGYFYASPDFTHNTSKGHPLADVSFQRRGALIDLSPSDSTMKRYLIPIVALIIGVGMMGGDVERKPKTDPKDWCYRVVTDGKVYRLQFHWTPDYWGDCIPERVYPTLEQAEEWREKGQLQAEDFAEDQKKNWNPVDGRAEPKPKSETTNLVYTNSVVFDRIDWIAVGTNAQEYLDAARYFKVVTNLVDLIAASGEWCNVRGHDWRDIAGTDRQVCVICWQHRSKPVPAPWSGLTNLWLTNSSSYLIPLAQ